MLLQLLSYSTDRSLGPVPCNYVTLCVCIQVWVYGSSFKSCLIAVVVPSEGVKTWAASQGIKGDMAAICEDPKTKEYILAVRGTLEP